MRHVIENIRPYSAAEAGAKYMVCMSNFMPMLIYHNRVFNRLQAFNLLRVGWSFCFCPGSGQIRTAYVMHRFLSNLQRFFAAKVEAISCSDSAALRDLLVERIGAGRPLFVYVDGVRNPVQHGDELAMPDGDGHLTFVAFGVDTESDRVLLINDYQRATGWVSIEFIARRLRKQIVHDIHLSENCQMPSPEVVKCILADKASDYLQQQNVTHRFRRFLLRALPEEWYKTHRELPPAGTISGPEGIVKFAEDVAWWTNTHRAEKAARLACRSLTGLQQERGIFLALLADMVGETANHGNLKHVYVRGKVLEDRWREATKLCSRVYMGKSRDVVFKLQQALRSIAEEEKSVVSLMRTVLKDSDRGTNSSESATNRMVLTRS